MPTLHVIMPEHNLKNNNFFTKSQDYAKYYAGIIRQGLATTWFAGYLDARQLQVKVGEDLSPLAPISAGFLKDPTLAPSYFSCTLYINTLPRSIPDGNRTDTYLYADDTALGRPGRIMLVILRDNANGNARKTVS